MFRVAPPVELKKLEAIFRHKVFPAMRETPEQGEDHEGDDRHGGESGYQPS
jgi:hypothetical protein